MREARRRHRRAGQAQPEIRCWCPRLTAPIAGVRHDARDGAVFAPPLRRTATPPPNYPARPSQGCVRVEWHGVTRPGAVSASTGARLRPDLRPGCRAPARARGGRAATRAIGEGQRANAR